MLPFGLPCRLIVIHPEKNKQKTFISALWLLSSHQLISWTLTQVKERKKYKVVTSFTFKPFIPSSEPVTLWHWPLLREWPLSPFHPNRSFTRCCSINDWLPLRKTEGKTQALLVLQCRRKPSGVQYNSNHSVEVSRALSRMFGDWHLPASFTDFTVHLRQIVLQTNAQCSHKLLSY